jgi:hypothetical protein
VQLIATFTDLMPLLTKHCTTLLKHYTSAPHLHGCAVRNCLVGVAALVGLLAVKVTPLTAAVPSNTLKNARQRPKKSQDTLKTH